MKKLIYIVTGLVVGAGIFGILSAGAYPITPTYGGGTGISTSTAGVNGFNLYQVGVNANNNPIYGFQANGSGGGGSGSITTSTRFNIGEFVVVSGTSTIMSTSTAMVTSFNGSSGA